LGSFRSVTRATWTITNTGSILAPNSGGIGVRVNSTGTVINGPTSGGSGYILGGSDGVLFNGGVGTVVNFGKIKAPGDYSYGILLAHGGAVTNGSTAVTGALIAAYGKYVTGIRLDGGGTIRNFGTISGGTSNTNGSYGIVSTGGGTIVNGASNSTAALITGSEEGIHLNDAAGVTAQFNKNLLVRANRELGADFDLNRWQHHAIYNSTEGRIEIYLISDNEQTVRIGDREFHFRAGEEILTEYSYKHTIAGFIELARQAGFHFEQVWTDGARWFGVFYFTVAN